MSTVNRPRPCQQHRLYGEQKPHATAGHITASPHGLQRRHCTEKGGAKHKQEDAKRRKKLLSRGKEMLSSEKETLPKTKEMLSRDMETLSTEKEMLSTDKKTLSKGNKMPNSTAEQRRSHLPHR